MHYEHVDGHAAATAVLSLSPATDYRGGLYLSNLTSRTLLPLEAGDAVVHASDLFHGVDVTDGERDFIEDAGLDVDGEGSTEDEDEDDAAERPSSPASSGGESLDEEDVAFANWLAGTRSPAVHRP